MRIENIRRTKKPRLWPICKHEIDGPLLERWFLKTAINMCQVSEGGLRWPTGQAIRDVPPKNLQESAFGMKQMPPQMGLYVVASVGDDIRSEDHVAFAPLLQARNTVVGGIYEFRGFRFILSMTNRPLPGILQSNGTVPATWDYAEPRFHLEAMRFKNGEHLSQIVTFRWPSRS